MTAAIPAPSSSIIRATQNAPQPAAGRGPAVSGAGAKPGPAPSADRRMEALGRVDLFSVLAETDLRRVSESLVERNYPSGSSIVHAEDPAGGHFFIVAEGEVAVVLETADGKETVLATLQRAQISGRLDPMFADREVWRRLAA